MKAFLHRDGSPDTSFGIRPVDPALGRAPGVIVRVLEDEEAVMKAERSGVYTLNGMRYVVKEGDVLPEGAVMDDEQRATGPAPENKSEPKAPENRAKGGKKS